MMWDNMVPDEEENIANIGCSDAVAREAAPSSASGNITDIAPRMSTTAVSLAQVTSAVGRGPIHNDVGELGHRLEDDAQLQADRRVTDSRTTDKTSDVERSP